MQLVRPAQEDGSISEFNAYVGLDVHKDSISVAIAEAGRDVKSGSGAWSGTRLKLWQGLRASWQATSRTPPVR